MNVVRIKDLVDKLPKPGETVAEIFSGMFSTAKASMERSWQHRFVDYEVDANCFPKSMKTLVEKYGRLVFNEKSDIPGTNEIEDAC